MTMNKETALVVFSGGQDSTTCLFWAKKHFKKVVALSFVYGQQPAVYMEWRLSWYQPRVKIHDRTVPEDCLSTLDSCSESLASLRTCVHTLPAVMYIGPPQYQGL